MEKELRNEEEIIDSLDDCNLMIAAFGMVGPASAGKPFDVRAVFEADIVPVDSQPLKKGEMWIRESRDFKVEIEGAAAGETYQVTLFFGDPADPGSQPLGSLGTYDEGDGKLEGPGLIVCGVPVGNPWIEISLDGEVHYVSGFEFEGCSSPSAPPAP